jgi:hypothetical protein
MNGVVSGTITEPEAMAIRPEEEYRDEILCVQKGGEY